MALQIWLPLNKDLHNQGIAKVTTSSSSSVISNYCCACNNSNYPVFNYTINQTTSFSLAFWIKIPTSITSYSKWQSFIYFAIRDNIAGTNTNIAINWATYNQLKIYESTNFQLLWKNLPYDTWTHLVITNETVNGTYYLKIYKDGELYDSASKSENGPSIRSGQLILGSEVESANGSVYFSDFRIYDHTLSQKEVTELSRGCILHYPCNDILNESTVNLTPYPTPGSAVEEIGWDPSNHLGAISVGNSWSVGYNGGVKSPSTGYHACWKLIDGQPTIVFVDKNTSIGYPHRWLGIKNNNSALINGISSNTTYTVSFEARSDDANMNIQSGLYYKQTSNGSIDFYDGQVKFAITNQWQKYSYTKTTSTVYSINGLYIYGYFNTSEGTSYVRNIQVEIKDHATVYTPLSRTQTQLKDVSGFNNHSTITGSLPLVSTPKSARYSESMEIQSGAANYASCTLAAAQVYSASLWIWFDSGVPNTANNNAILFTLNPSKYNIALNFRNGDSVIVHNGKSQIGSKYDLTGKYKSNAWNHFVINDNGSTTELWVNGVKLTSPSNSGIYEQFEFVLGGRISDDWFYRGKISDFRLFTRALTQVDVDDLYKDGFAIDKNQNGFTYELNENDSYSTVEVKKNGQLVCSDYEEGQLLMLKMYWDMYDEEYKLDYQDYYAYEGKTTIWEGQKCYIWQRYDAGYEAFDYEDTDNSENIILTNTLNIKMPFNGSSPEFVAAIGLDGNECYNEPRLAKWANSDSGGEYEGMIKLEGVNSGVNGNEIARICKSGKVTTREIHEI